MTHAIDTVFIDAILVRLLLELGLPESLPLIKLSPRMQEWIVDEAEALRRDAMTHPTVAVLVKRPTAALFVGILALAGISGAQEPPSSQRPVPESPAMAEDNAAPTSLRELTQEAEQKNPQIAASFHAWQASRNVPKQASALPVATG
jgi:hypothetical protein